MEESGNPFGSDRYENRDNAHSQTKKFLSNLAPILHGEAGGIGFGASDIQHGVAPNKDGSLPIRYDVVCVRSNAYGTNPTCVVPCS